MKFEKYFSICMYNLKNLKHKNFQRVFVIMNGPGTSKINWEIINKELESEECCVILTNGSLAKSKLIDVENIIYLSNDSIIDWFLEGGLEKLNTGNYEDFKKRFPYFEDKNLPALKYDLESCNELVRRKRTTIATRSNQIKNGFVNPERILKFDSNVFSKILYRISYVWHQDGSSPENRLKKIGIRIWPTHSRLWSVIKKFPPFMKIWYTINFNQTPNTFYRALDLASNLNTREICFVGRNSQLLDWINLNNKTNKNEIKLKYRYFFSEVEQEIKIKKFDYLLREAYYSSQYIEMMQSVFPWINYVALEKNICYMDYCSIKHVGKYMLENDEIEEKKYELDQNPNDHFVDFKSFS